MGNILKNIRSKLSNKIGRKILGFMIILGVGTFAFSTNTNVYAVDDTTTENVETDKETDKIIDFNDGATKILQLIYSLLWPVLFIAGIALDNTLVYGSFLHIDASLWSLWNIIKNFANFALGFMMLFAIVRSLFSFGDGNTKWKPQTIIKNTLIAGVLIQMSRFLMAALIDVSTILTYSIGGLPMTVLQNNETYKDMPVMGVNAKLEKQEDNDDKLGINYYHTYAGKKISLCDVREVNGLTGSYIIGKKEVFVGSGEYFEKGFCALGAWPYKFEELGSNTNPPFDTGYDDNISYNTTVDNYFSSLTTGQSQGLEAACHIISLDRQKIPETCLDNNFGAVDKGGDFFTKDIDEDSKITIDSLLEKSKGFVGPFVTIYSSLLDYTTIVDEPGQKEDVISTFFIVLIKVLFAAALFFPLLALAVVLLLRIGILWLAIAAIPVIILFAVFKDVLGGSGDIKNVFPWFSISHLIKLIFAPVFVVFAVSMSLIFLTALGGPKDFKNTNLSQDEAILSEFGMEKVDMKTYSILGIVEFELDQNMVNDGLDTFAWLITKLFAVGIIWFFLFAAVKATVKDTGLDKKIGELQKGVQRLMGTIPVVPIPGGGAVGIGAVKDKLGGIGSGMGTEALEAQKEMLENQVPWLFGGNKKPEEEAGKLSALAPATVSAITGAFAEGKSAQDVFKNLEAADKEALAAQGITTAESLSTAYNTYVTNNVSTMEGIEKLLGQAETSAGVTTYDAENLANSTIENMANSGGDWQQRAKGVVGGNVKTAGGTYVMVNKGSHASPEFKLVTQEEYNDMLGMKPEDVDVNQIKTDLEEKLTVDYGLTEDLKKDLSEEDIDRLEEQYKAELQRHIAQIDKLNNTNIENTSATDPADPSGTGTGGTGTGGTGTGG